MKELRGRKETNPETASNGSEVKKLKSEAAEVDEDPERPAGNIV